MDWIWLVIGLFWVAGFAVEIRGRQRAGAVLLDIGYNPQREMQLGMGGMLLLMGSYMALTSSRYLFQGLAFVAWGMTQFALATHRVQLRQAGIFGRRKLIRWEEILEYSLDIKGQLALKLRQSQKWTSLGRVDFVQRQEVCDLLASRVPAAAGARNPE